ncbi:Uncharacterised protein [Mycobacteroides abscessus subsp. abscessus]|nr:Uncharacterised protein [Mycobacteroides abscessus subsp. abscessus]
MTATARLTLVLKWLLMIRGILKVKIVKSKILQKMPL